MNSVTPDFRKKLAMFRKLLFIATLLVVFEISPGGSLIGLDSCPRLAQAAKDKSDMNGDEVVDLEDLKLFSQRELGLAWTNVNWCQWIEDNPKKERQYPHLFDFIREYFSCDSTVPILSNPTVLEINIPSATLGATIVNDGGDPILERGTVWNTTGPPIMENQLAEGGTALGPFSHVRTDLMGVEIGTQIYFRGYAVNSVGTGFSPESSFIVESPLVPKNANDRPTRMALGPAGNLYVSDAKVRSVFIYDASLQVTGELKDLDSPVGVAVDSAGFIYVGNSGIANVEKYNSEGQLIATIGEGMIRMPTDLTLDWDDNLYVADLESDLVWVFKPDGTPLRPIRKGGLKSPMAVEIAYAADGSNQQELYVADKGNYLVKVFDLQGNLIRSFGGFPEKGGMMGTTWYWQGKFISLQSLAVDAQGDLHALDIYMNRVQILDPVTGAYIADYGEYGTGAGQLKVPQDIIINNAGDVIVANSDNKRVEVIY
jgi:hypothetical protein